MIRFERHRAARRRDPLPGPRLRPAALIAASAAAFLAGCGSGGPAGGERIFDPAEHPELARGELLSFACRACHGLAPGDPSPLGPPLHGMFGRRAGSLPGYDYSQALKDSGIVWTEETLDAWLASPDEYIPGNKMVFAGYRSADDRRALIEYLKLQTEKAP